MREVGYHSPQEGQDSLGGNYTVWLLFKEDRKWHSPKDESGLPRNLDTRQHVKALDGRYLEISRLQRSRKRP
jgi:hypothetical protein